MGYREAEELMGDVRRWDANQWDTRDVGAQVYWGARDGPDHDRHRAATRAISGKAAGGDPQAQLAEALLKRLEGDIQVAVRQALRHQADEKLEDDYLAQQYPNAKLAVVHAVTGEAARPWISAEDANVLTAGLRASDEKLDFDFTVETRDQEGWDATAAFVDELRTAFPGTQVTFDPPHKRPVGRFSVIGTTYMPGVDAHDQLRRDLESRFRRYDPAGHLAWPPPDFRSTRPRH
jgi:hypothetical protein